MSRASVLVVDDDADFRSLVRGELVDAGYEVALAAGAEEGLQQLLGEDVDVLLLDLQMPGKNGCELLREARQMGVQSETIVVTAYPQLDIAEECLDAGAFELLEKPFSSRMLLSTVAHAVERSRLLRTAILYDASRAVFASQDPGRIPQVIVETAASALRADQASLMVPEGPHHLVIAYSKGFPEQVRSSYVVRLGEGIAGRVAKDGKPVLIVGRASEDPRFRGVRAHGRVHSSIVYPLMAGTRLVGVLNVSRGGKHNPFRPPDLELASVFASQALLALENVSLVRQAVHNERLAFAGRLAAELSHEVANPAAFVISNLEFLLEELRSTSGPGSAERLGAARDALEGARRIARVVGDMRAALRGEEKELATCDLNDAVRFALRMSARQVSNAQVTTSLGEGAQVRGDEARLGQVFLNLLVNAGQALAGRPDARVRVTTERNGNEVCVVVADNGPGIAAADQRRIFDAFFTTKRKEAGSGLGLAISREIVAQHGGELSVESEEGKGSRFIVKLPAAR
jgi:signal transduction histidine kinase/CheY-like chemotaxis protein